MAPPPPRIMAGMACLAARNMVSTLTCMTRRQFSWVSSTTDPRLPMPTLLSRRSRRPKRSSAVLTMPAQSSARVTSARSATASPPWSLIMRTVCSARSISRSTTMTRAPARARRMAAARPLPMPVRAAPAPVTIATFPLSPQSSGTSRLEAMDSLTITGSSGRATWGLCRSGRPGGRMRAERHRRARPEGGCLRQPGSGLDVAKPAERRVHVRDEILDRLQREIAGAPAVDAPEGIDPAPGLGQRHADEVAAALARAAGERDERAEGGEISRAVVHDLSGQVLRPIGAHGKAVLVGHAAHGLDDRLESSPLVPRASVAEGGKRHADDAGADLCQVVGGEAEAGERAGSIGLTEDVCASDEGAKLCGGVRLTQVERGRELAEAGVDDEPGQIRQMRRGDEQHIGTVRSKGAPAHGSCDDARKIEHADAGQRARPRARGFGRCLADLLDLQEGEGGDGETLRMRVPFRTRAHNAGGEPRGGEGILEIARRPLRHRVLDALPRALAAE